MYEDCEGIGEYRIVVFFYFEGSSIMSENNPIVISESNGSSSAVPNQHPLPAPTTLPRPDIPPASMHPGLSERHRRNMPSEAAWARVDFATMTPREVARELTSEIPNRRASAGTKTAKEYRAMDDADSAYDLEDMPITDSCDVVRQVSVFRTFPCSTSNLTSRICQLRAFPLRVLFHSL